VSSKRKLVDSNLIVRYLVQDHERQAKTAEELLLPAIEAKWSS